MELPNYVLVSKPHGAIAICHSYKWLIEDRLVIYEFRSVERCAEYEVLDVLRNKRHWIIPE